MRMNSRIWKFWFFLDMIDDSDGIHPQVIKSNKLSAKVLRVDGDVFICGDDDYFWIIGLSDAKMYERDPALLYTAVVISTFTEQPSS